MPYDREWVAQYIARKREHMDAANELTKRMIARSRERLALSEELLRKTAPTWPSRRPLSLPDPEKTEEARRVAQENAEHQRELAKSLRRKMN